MFWNVALWDFMGVTQVYIARLESSVLVREESSLLIPVHWWYNTFYCFISTCSLRLFSLFHQHLNHFAIMVMSDWLAVGVSIKEGLSCALMVAGGLCMVETGATLMLQ